MPYHRAGNNAARGLKRHFPSHQSKEPRQIPAALGPQIRKLMVEEVQTETDHGTIEITDCRYLASYNLMDNLSKTILVPGRPPLWTPSSDNMKLKADSGNYYRDANAATFEKYPLEPAVRSIFHMNPSFDPSIVDTFACGSTLGNLLRFVQGRGEPFSLTVHTIGPTAFFVRRDLSPTELIDGVHGFGHNFVDANTTWSPDVKGSSSHQRIVTYSFGSNTFLVRFEADSYTMDQTDGFDSEDDGGGVPIDATSVEDGLANMLQANDPKKLRDDVVLLKKGLPSAQSSIIDIKTRSARKQRNDIMIEQLPRLWLRQIENIVLSFHKNGVFGRAVVEDIRPMILQWEDENQTVIGRLFNLINLIREAAKIADGGKLEVRCSEAANLYFHEMSTPGQSEINPLPDDLRVLWDQR